MKKMLFIQNIRVAPRKPDKKSEKKRRKFRCKIFKVAFRGIEALWMLSEIMKYLMQIFK